MNIVGFIISLVLFLFEHGLRMKYGFSRNNSLSGWMRIATRGRIFLVFHIGIMDM